VIGSRDKRRSGGNDTLTPVDTDSDEGIEEFIPSANWSLMAALARADMNETVVTEYDEHSLGGGRLTPQMTSMDMSRDQSDDGIIIIIISSNYFYYNSSYIIRSKGACA